MLADGYASKDACQVASESEAGSQIDKVHLGGFVTRIKVVGGLAHIPGQDPVSRW